MFLGLRPSQARSHFSWVFLSFLSMISRTFLMLSMISLHFSMIFLGFPEFPRYVDELSKLQDSMPADSLELVEKLLTKDREITRWGFPTNRCCAQLASAPFPKKPTMKEESPTSEGLEIQRIAGVWGFTGFGKVIPWYPPGNMVYFMRPYAGPGAGKHLAGTHSAGSRASAGQRDHCAGHQQMMNWQYA